MERNGTGDSKRRQAHGQRRAPAVEVAGSAEPVPGEPEVCVTALGSGAQKHRSVRCLWVQVTNRNNNRRGRGAARDPCDRAPAVGCTPEMTSRDLTGRRRIVLGFSERPTRGPVLCQEPLTSDGVRRRGSLTARLTKRSKARPGDFRIRPVTCGPLVRSSRKGRTWDFAVLFAVPPRGKR